MRAFIFMLVGLVFFGVSTLFIISANQFVAHSEPARLIAVDVDSKRDSDGDRLYRPVFALESAPEPREEYAGNMWSNPQPHRVGDIVDGRYNAETGEMRSDKMLTMGRWMLRIMQIIGGLLFLRGAVWLLFMGAAVMALITNLRRSK